jgi:hypothetical protein
MKTRLRVCLNNGDHNEAGTQPQLLRNLNQDGAILWLRRRNRSWTSFNIKKIILIAIDCISFSYYILLVRSMKRIETFDFVIIAASMCVCKRTSEKTDYMVHWKCKIYVIKIIFSNGNTFLLFSMRTVHLRLVVPFWPLLLVTMR